jgi:hypothetical protein
MENKLFTWLLDLMPGALQALDVLHGHMSQERKARRRMLGGPNWWKGGDRPEAHLI